MLSTVYDRIIVELFQRHWKPDITEFEFSRGELEEIIDHLGIERPRNLGDIIYTFRYRRPFPSAILDTQSDNLQWSLRLSGHGQYRMSLSESVVILPDKSLSTISIPDATPALIKEFALGDEQALLAILRYNRLVDIFTGITCFSLQNHLRTTVKDIGQIETDELYVGVDSAGVLYILPIQAKGGNDRLSTVQIEQDLYLCSEKFSRLVCKPIGALFMSKNVIALFQFKKENGKIRNIKECHYKLIL